LELGIESKLEGVLRSMVGLRPLQSEMNVTDGWIENDSGIGTEGCGRETEGSIGNVY
jgi:hypothetical protein